MKIPKLTAAQTAQILGDPLPQGFAANSLAFRFPDGKESPRTLTNLWDMIEFLGYDFLNLLLKLDQEGKDAHQKVKKYDDENPRTNIEDNRRLNNLLSNLSTHCRRLQLAESSHKIQHFASLISNPVARECSFRVIESEISGLRFCLFCDLREQRFAFIPVKKAEYFERDDLFGHDVHKKAPVEINAEIKAAGNCVTVDLNTAAVFHLMRVAEFGLRRLAKRLHVKLKYPLDFSDWGTVIDRCQKELDTLKPLTRGKRKSAQLEFYANAVSDCRAFKETWRDCVMHFRRTEFQPKEALVVLDRVREFMKRLEAESLLK